MRIVDRARELAALVPERTLRKEEVTATEQWVLAWPLLGLFALLSGFVLRGDAEAEAALAPLVLVIAAVIGLLVFHALSLEIHQRREEIRTLRSVGASPGLVAAVYEGQALTLAAVGATVGAGLGIVLSRVLPRRVGPRGGGVSRATTAFSRLLVAWAILEGAAMFPLVAYLVTGDPFLFLLVAVVIAANASLFPSEARWASLAAQPLPSAAGKGRMVR